MWIITATYKERVVTYKVSTESEEDVLILARGLYNTQRIENVKVENSGKLIKEYR